MKNLASIICSPWFFVPMSILGAIGAFLVYIIYGLYQESRMASIALFPAIVQRAIVDQGEDGLSLVRLGDITGYRQLGHQFSNIPDEYLYDWPGDCTLPLNFKSLDPYSVPGTYQANLDTKKPKVIIFFYGPVPDVSPYLDLNNQDRLLTRRPSNYRELPSSQLEWLTWIDIGDHRPWLNALTDGGRNSIRWRGEQCDGYSYIIFEGDRS